MQMIQHFLTQIHKSNFNSLIHFQLLLDIIINFNKKIIQDSQRIIKLTSTHFSSIQHICSNNKRYQ